MTHLLNIGAHKVAISVRYTVFLCHGLIWILGVLLYPEFFQRYKMLPVFYEVATPLALKSTSFYRLSRALLQKTFKKYSVILKLGF